VITYEKLKSALPKNSLDPTLAVAQIEAESNGNQFATRFEPKVYDSFIKQGISPDLARLKATSYGSFQIMGYNLESLGYSLSKIQDYLNSESQQLESFVKFAVPLWSASSSQMEPTNYYLARYNGGTGATSMRNTNGFYGKAEPYVFTVKKIAGWLHPSDAQRLKLYETWLKETGQEPSFFWMGLILAAGLIGLVFNGNKKTSIKY